jgi:regulator of protease activity HflC (stomatin/prohibitin superfamily)
MDTRVQKHTTRYDAASKDLQAVHVDMVLNYRLMPDRAPEVYKSIGLGYTSVIVDPAAQEVLKAQTAMHNAAEILEEQKAEQKRYELVQAQRQAEIAAATAKGKGDAAREEARGVAEALRLKGDAEAAYNARVAASLTPVLIQQQYLARWGGRLPQYTLGGSGAVPFLQIPTPGEGRR